MHCNLPHGCESSPSTAEVFSNPLDSSSPLSWWAHVPSPLLPTIGCAFPFFHSSLKEKGISGKLTGRTRKRDSSKVQVLASGHYSPFSCNPSKCSHLKCDRRSVLLLCSSWGISPVLTGPPWRVSCSEPWMSSHGKKSHGNCSSLLWSFENLAKTTGKLCRFLCLHLLNAPLFFSRCCSSFFSISGTKIMFSFCVPACRQQATFLSGEGVCPLSQQS